MNNFLQETRTQRPRIYIQVWIAFVLNEVMVEFAELRKAPLKLVAGDILFRWVPNGLADSSRFWKT